MTKLPVPNLNLKTTPLPFGGQSNTGQTLAINNRYFTKNGKPWFPTMGEFHFSRYPTQYWEESLQKMRAGGIQIVASYIFWIHHEEEKGKWDFTGQRNLGHFIKLCAKLNYPIFLRIGPWAHGECRNGGFPDWLQHDKTITLRSDDPTYLSYVRHLYQKIYEAAKGYLFKDGGPIIGLQIENEYGHCGGPSGGEGLTHMSTLKKIAVETGFEVPFYTATGWGGANVVDNEMLPVQGGYADAPWDRTLTQLPANPNYLLLPTLNDPLIGSDFGQSKETFTFCVENYPYLTAELGGGIQVTAHRRPIISANDTAAQALCKLATGANLLGYYMYHGGTNPEGKLSTLQESKASGGYTDVPTLSYDFQACIGEYGELHQSYKQLKRIHMFLQDFGDIIAPSVSFFPPNKVENADDTTNLRACVRHDNATNTGFVFVNNHQRHQTMPNHQNVNLSVELPNETINLPTMNIPSGFYGMFPYNIQLGDAFLKSTNAQLLCKLGQQYVFYCHEAPIFNYTGNPAPMIVLTQEEANNAWHFGNKLYITNGNLIEKDDGVQLTTCNTEETVTTYPHFRVGVDTVHEVHQSHSESAHKNTTTYTFSPVSYTGSFKQTHQNETYTEYEITLDRITPEGINDIFLTIDYTGDRAELYQDGKMIADWFTTGLPWRIGLRRFGYKSNFTLKIFPVTQETYFECTPPKGYKLNNIALEPQYATLI